MENARVNQLVIRKVDVNIVQIICMVITVITLVLKIVDLAHQTLPVHGVKHFITDHIVSIDVHMAAMVLDIVIKLPDIVI